MTWRGRLARGWVAAALAACGCTAGPPPLPALPPEATAAREEHPDVARSQKPEAAANRANAKVCLIDLPVDRPAEAAHASPAATIRAVVNDMPILDEDVKISCYQQLAAARTPAQQQEIYRQALEQLIDREVIVQEAMAGLERGGPQGAKIIDKLKEEANLEFEKRWLKPMMKQSHISSKEEFAAFMREHHLSLEVMRRWQERNFMAMQYLLTRIQPHLSRIGHTEIADYYASHSEEFTRPDSVHWQDIFIDATQHASRDAAREFAESLVRRVRAGENFAKLSAEFDNGTSGRFRKGDGQGHKRGEIFPPEAEPILFQMQDGDIEIVERPRGFHVIRLVKREYAGPIPFDVKVQKEIRDRLRNIKFQEEMKDIVKTLRSKAVIEKASTAN